MKQGDIYRHKKTGKLYSIVSDNFKVKEFKETVRLTMPDSFDDEWINKYEWKEGLILYKAEYDCPGCPFFARYPEDFYKEFKRVNTDAEETEQKSESSEAKKEIPTDPLENNIMFGTDEKYAKGQLYKKFFNQSQIEWIQEGLVSRPERIEDFVEIPDDTCAGFVISDMGRDDIVGLNLGEYHKFDNKFYFRTVRNGCFGALAPMTSVVIGFIPFNNKNKSNNEND